MLASAIAVRHAQHFEVDMLAKKLTAKSQKIHRLVITITLFFAGAILVYASIPFIELGLLKKNPATGIPMITIYASIPIGGVLIMLMSVDYIYRRLNNNDNKAANNGL